VGNGLTPNWAKSNEVALSVYGRSGKT